jgi:prepilin-type N-terminal cleavage/methylation domain-containing protein
MVPMNEERGMTLLEVLVALMVLGLVGLSYLELFHQSHRMVGDSRQWSAAVAYAEDAMEAAKLRGVEAQPVVEDLPGGFQREITGVQWQPGLLAVQVSVSLPGGGRFNLARLLQLEPPLARSTSLTEEPTD